MVNWIIGGLIFGFTAFIIVRTILRMRKGKSCCCNDCSQSQCSLRDQKRV
ncbi:MAG TPA: FeoB-associated Cys-rich membrane protein [Clostridia bacterium]